MRKSKNNKKSTRSSPNKKSKGVKSKKKSKCFPKVYDRKTKRCRKSKRKTSVITEPYKNPEAKAARRLAEQKVAGLMLELTLLRQEIGELQ
jgi:hypothetical protein